MTLFYFKSWVGEVGGMHRIKPFENVMKTREMQENMPGWRKGRRIRIDEDAQWIGKQKLLRPGRKAECRPERGACRGP
jgi:hypothetical protein